MSNAKTTAKKQNQIAETFRLLCRNRSAVLGLIIVAMLAGE